MSVPTNIKVYLNESRDSFFGFRNEFSSPELRLAAEFVVDGPATDFIKGKPIGVLEEVFEQLNVGGDIVPATDWTTEYRANGNRSLSVGDVVVVGESAFAVGRFGWDDVSTSELVEAIGGAATA